MRRFFYMIVVVVLGACTPERRPDGAPGQKPTKVRPTIEPDQSSPEASDLPPEIEARRRAAVAELRAGNHDAGRDQLQELADEVGPSYALLNDLAIAEGLRGQWRAALGHVNEALRLDPTGLEAATNKVEVLLELGDRARAVDTANDAVERHPRAASAHIALGKAYFSLGRYRQARASFENALDREPDDLTAALGVLAVMCVLTNEPEGEEVIERMLARAPDDPHVLHLVAIARDARLDDKLARDYYERALAAAEAKKLPLPWAHYNLGRLLERVNGVAAARAHYTKFLELAPPSAVFEREYVEKQLADPQGGKPQ